MSFSENADKLKNQNITPLAHPDQFVRRHIGPNATETAAMLAELGVTPVAKDDESAKALEAPAQNIRQVPPPARQQ